jgi:hypothetical protein
MPDLERLLVSNCTELPACRCGKEMHIDHTHPLPERADTHIRVYRCLACNHEMRLTVWGVDPAIVSHSSESGCEQGRCCGAIPPAVAMLAAIRRVSLFLSNYLTSSEIRQLC